MSTQDIIICVAVAIVSVAIGLFFGFVPMKTDKTTESQNKYSQALGIVAVGLTILLIFAKQNLASWVAIFAMIAGWPSPRPRRCTAGYFTASRGSSPPSRRHR